MKAISLVQGSEDWKKWRRSHLTASNVAAIMGLSPFSTPLDVYEEMILGKEKAFNRAMRHGVQYEDEAREWVSQKLDIQPVAVCMESLKYPWAAASLDGYDLLTETVIEIKCPGKETHLKIMSGDIPLHYMIQMQWQMFVCEVKKAIFVSYYKDPQDPDREGHGLHIEVKRDESMIQKAFKACYDFYHNHIQSETPPLACDRDFIKEDSKEWISHAEEAVFWLKKKKELQELLDQCNYEIDVRTTQLEKLADGKTRVKGAGISYIQYSRKGAIDYTKVPELISLDLEKYRKPSTVITTIKLEKDIL